MKPLPKKATRNVTMAALLIEEVTRQLAKEYSFSRSDVSSRIESVPIKERKSPQLMSIISLERGAHCPFLRPFSEVGTLGTQN